MKWACDPPTKRFDISPPWLGDAQKVWMRSDFSLNMLGDAAHLASQGVQKVVQNYARNNLL